MKRARPDVLARLRAAGLVDDARVVVAPMPLGAGGLGRWWNEPPRAWRPCEADVACLAERTGGAWWAVHARDGVEWRLCRGLYARDGRAVPLVDARDVGGGVRAGRVRAPPALAALRRTFRYWLVVAVVRDGLLPYPAEDPAARALYALMADHTLALAGAPSADEAAVRAYLGDAPPPAFDAAWAAYARAWAALALAPALLAAAFVARLRLRVRASYAPGGAGYARAAARWAARLA
jgi:hypothetical protein